MKLNIATYNICHAQSYDVYCNTGETEISTDNIADVLYRNDVAICGMNEVDWNCPRTEYINEPYLIAKELTARTGVQHYWAFAAGLENYYAPHALYGNALISRYPIVKSKVVHVAVHEIDPEKPKTQIQKPWYERRALLVAELDVEGKPMTVMVTHFGLTEEEQLLMMDVVEKEAAEANGPIFFLGDFNITDKCVNVYTRITDLFNDTATDPTMPKTFPSTGADRKIDFIFADKSLTTENCRVEEVQHSDHLPLFVSTEW